MNSLVWLDFQRLASAHTPQPYVVPLYACLCGPFSLCAAMFMACC